MSFKRNITFAAIFTSTVFTTMHLMNRFVSYIATSDNNLNEDTLSYYEWRFGKIAYRKLGNGSPLLLVHNLSVCSSSHEWKNIEDKLAEKHTVYTLDLLGCGCSDHPLLTYTNYLYVQLITDFIKHVIGNTTDVIVSGDSSSFILMACANDSTIINRIIMINPQNLISLAKIPTKQTKFLKYLITAPVLGTFIYNIKFSKKAIAQNFSDKYFYDCNRIFENEILSCFESCHKDRSHAKYLYASQISRFTNANVISCLNKLNNSIFIITGNANPENILAANQYQNQLPSIEIIGMEKTKQLPHIEKRDEFITHVNILFYEEETNI